MWIVIGVAIGLVGVVVVVLVAARRSMSVERQVVTGDQLFWLGVIYTATGVTLVSTIGPGMIGILALGIVFMGMGANRRREDAGRD